MIIAIDPGPKQSAYVIWDGVKIYDFGIVNNWGIRTVLHDIVDTVWMAAIEMVASYGMPVGREVFETCVWIGRFCELATEHDFVYRKDVKMHLCQSMRAKDSNIRQALIDRFGPPGRKKEPGLTYGLKKDLWAAFAVAVTWWDINRGKEV
jgi:hypothetical protein